MSILDPRHRRIDHLTRRDRVLEREPDTFRESLTTNVPGRTYRSEVDLADLQPSAAELAVRYIATAIMGLLAIRFVVGLFTTDTTNALVGLIYNLTDWAVRPFQNLFGQTPTGAGGYLDLPALAAIAVIGLLAAVLVRLARVPRV